MAGENLSLKHQLEASCRRNDQLQAAVQDMEVGVVAARQREQDLQRQVCQLLCYTERRAVSLQPMRFVTGYWLNRQQSRYARI